MKTGSFFTAKGNGRISIARSSPRGIVVPAYRPLAPGSWFNSVGYEEYRKLYFAQLNKLDPLKTWEDLHNLVNGNEPIILCWERLNTPGNWCHRQMVAEWFNKTLGFEVLEVGSTKKPAEKTQAGLF